MSASSSDAGIVAASEDDESSVVVEVVPDESSVELVSVVLVSVVDELSLVLEESVELLSVVLVSVVDELSLVPELAFLFSSSLTASHSSSDSPYSAQTSSTTSDP
jgi:hypothetical protein